MLWENIMLALFMIAFHSALSAAIQSRHTSLSPMPSASRFLVGTKFSDLINANVTVVVDPLRVIYETFDGTTGLTANQPDEAAQRLRSRIGGGKVDCRLTIHRDVCTSPRIRSMERIAWDTRICFQWKCSSPSDKQRNNLTTRRGNKDDGPSTASKNSNFAMRIENCWTGSIQNPIFMVNKNGCTNERTMITSPVYDGALQAAVSYGWLSVRLVGVDHIRLVCAIRLCSVCDKQCALITPPKCLDDPQNTSKQSSTALTIWRRLDAIEALCNALELPSDSSQSSSATSNHHHIPLSCFSCSRKSFFQCQIYFPSIITMIALSLLTFFFILLK